MDSTKRSNGASSTTMVNSTIAQRRHNILQHGYEVEDNLTSDGWKLQKSLLTRKVNPSQIKQS